MRWLKGRPVRFLEQILVAEEGILALRQWWLIISWHRNCYRWSHLANLLLLLESIEAILSVLIPDALVCALFAHFCQELPILESWRLLDSLVESISFDCAISIATWLIDHATLESVWHWLQMWVHHQMRVRQSGRWTLVLNHLAFLSRIIINLVGLSKLIWLFWWLHLVHACGILRISTSIHLNLLVQLISGYLVHWRGLLKIWRNVLAPVWVIALCRRNAEIGWWLILLDDLPLLLEIKSFIKDLSLRWWSLHCLLMNWRGWLVRRERLRLLFTVWLDHLLRWHLLRIISHIIVRHIVILHFKLHVHLISLLFLWLESVYELLKVLFLITDLSLEIAAGGRIIRIVFKFDLTL